eukprot:6546007-Ditylum_brightwellii.AAC.1
MTANDTMSTSTSSMSTPDNNTQGNKFPKLIPALGIPPVTPDQHIVPKNHPDQSSGTKESQTTKIDGGIDVPLKPL